jgi:uncharacterized Zn finger protein (UPF0148 family)
MTNHFKKSRTIFCPVCSTERELPKKKNRAGRQCIKSVAWSVLWGMMAHLIGGLEVAIWVAFLSGVLCFLVLEVYDSVKFKRELICPVCQFDPLLYRRSPEEAKERCLGWLASPESMKSSHSGRMAGKQQVSSKSRGSQPLTEGSFQNP